MRKGCFVIQLRASTKNQTYWIRGVVLRHQKWFC